MYARNIFLNFEKLTPSVDKEERAQSMVGRVRVHGVRFFRDADWYPAFETELCQFPRGQHDDQVDAFAILGLALMQLTTAPTTEEQENEEYEDDKRQAGFFNDGRSHVTGY
jgi:phage terminase large subunit-like protein